MRSFPKKQRTNSELVLSISLLMVMGGIFWRTVFQPGMTAYAKSTRTDADTVAQKQITLTSPSDGTPTRLRIPRLSVNAKIESVALAKDGSMGVPKHPLDTAWYELGPRPGERGSAVIAGHVDWYNGAKAVFAKLGALKPGDKLSVEDARGVRTTFIVRASRNYNANDDATAIFSSGDDGAHLNLVTCGGSWSKRAKQYTKRFVVFTDKIEDTQ